MTAKFVVLFVVAMALTQGQAITDIRLEDQYSTFLTNQIIPKTFTIPKSFLDTLVGCEVTYPNGVRRELYPINRLPAGPIIYLQAAQPFTSCGIGFVGADVSLSGTYELASMVLHSADKSNSLTKQRLHLKLVEIKP